MRVWFIFPAGLAALLPPATRHSQNHTWPVGNSRHNNRGFPERQLLANEATWWVAEYAARRQLALDAALVYPDGRRYAIGSATALKAVQALLKTVRIRGRFTSMPEQCRLQ